MKKEVDWAEEVTKEIIKEISYWINNERLIIHLSEIIKKILRKYL